jgi:hypothetical protein
MTRLGNEARDERRGLSAVQPGGNGHGERHQRKAGGQRQRPQPGDGLTPGAEATTCDEVGDRESGLPRALACLHPIARTAPKQNLAEVHHETSNVGRHHRGGWRPLQRDLHEIVLHRHGGDVQHPCNSRVCSVQIESWTAADAQGEKTG